MAPRLQLLVCTAWLLLLLVARCSPAPFSCASVGGSCAATCSKASVATSDCWSGGGAVCCVAYNPAVQADQLTHAQATAVLSFSNALCSSRASASQFCPTMEGVNAALVNELVTALARSTQCGARSLTEGTENVPRTGSAGPCSALSGGRMKISVSAGCASAAFATSSRLVWSEPTGCYTSTVRTNFLLCKGTTSTSWVAYYCAAASAGACGPHAAFWSDALSNPILRWLTPAAVVNAQEASQGNMVTTPSGRHVCLDGRMGLMLAARSSGVVTVGQLSSGSVASGSRQNEGRAVQVNADLGTCPAMFGCRVNERIRGTSWYEVSWLPPGTTTAISTPSPASSCSNADQTTMFSAQTLRCFEEMPIELLSTDYCALYKSPEPWRYIFSCLRQSEKAWSCYWVPAYNNACSFYAQNGYLLSTVGTGFCGITYEALVRNICAGFYSSGTRLVVTARNPSLVTSCTTYVSDVQGASGQPMTYSCRGSGGVAESYSSSTDIDYGTVRDDLSSSANLQATAGGVNVLVVHPTDEKSNKAVVSAAAVLALGVVATGSIILAFVYLRGKKLPLVSVERYSAWRPTLSVIGLVALVIAATSLNWAQTAPRDGRLSVHWRR